jgi:hypothetical protein
MDEVGELLAERQDGLRRLTYIMVALENTTCRQGSPQPCMASGYPSDRSR